MPRIPTYVAPTEVIRPNETGSTELQNAARRINPLYSSIAENDRRQGQIDVQKYKDLQWPLDIAKLYEDRNTQKTAGGVRLAGTGSTRGHGQVSRGAGTLGRALSDGGYYLGSGTGSGSGPGTVEYAGSNGYDYPSAAGPTYDYNPSPAQVAQDKYNTKVDAAVQGYTDAVVQQNNNTQDYWAKYYGLGTSGLSSILPSQRTISDVNQYDEYGNPISSSGSAPPPVPSDTSTSGGGIWSGLSSWISGSDGTSTSDNGDQSATTSTGY